MTDECGTCGAGPRSPYRREHAEWCEPTKDLMDRLTPFHELGESVTWVYEHASATWGLPAEVIRKSDILRRHLHKTSRYQSNLPDDVVAEIRSLRDRCD